MIRILFKFFFVLTCIFYAGSASAATYYVAKTGSDSNSCPTATQGGSDSSKAKLTVGAGASCLVAGDTLYIKAGTYSEPGNSVNLPGASSWAGATTVSNFGSDIVTFRGVGNPFHTFNSSAAYVILNGFIFDGINDGWADCIAIGQGPHHIRFKNFECKNFGANGVSAGESNVSGNEFINGKIHDGGTTVFDNAVYIRGSGNLVEHLEIYRWAGAGVQLYSGVQGTVNNNIVRFNSIHDTSGGTNWSNNTNTGGFTNYDRTDGIIIQNGDGNLVYNNLIYNMLTTYNNTTTPPCCGGVSVGGGATNSKVFNNTIYNNFTEGIYLSGAGGGNTIKNNIVFNNADGNIVNSVSGTILSNNLCNSGCNINSDPLFVGSNDFHLRSVSPAINAGVTLSEVTSDFDGVTRPVGTAYDIGAYEYVSGTASLSGDINGDRIVNSLDWSLMSAKWLTNDTNADLNKDGAVNSLDWSIMSGNWLASL